MAGSLPTFKCRFCGRSFRIAKAGDYVKWADHFDRCKTAHSAAS